MNGGPYDPSETHPEEFEDESIWPKKKEWDEVPEALGEEAKKMLQEREEIKAREEAERSARLDKVFEETGERSKGWAAYRDHIVKGTPLSEFSDEDRKYIEEQLQEIEKRRHKDSQGQRQQDEREELEIKQGHDEFAMAEAKRFVTRDLPAEHGQKNQELQQKHEKENLTREEFQEKAKDTRETPPEKTGFQKLRQEARQREGTRENPPEQERSGLQKLKADAKDRDSSGPSSQERPPDEHPHDR